MVVSPASNMRREIAQNAILAATALAANVTSSGARRARSKRPRRACMTVAGCFDAMVRGCSSSLVVATKRRIFCISPPPSRPQLRPMRDRSTTRLPSLWMSASALTALITVVFGVQRWIDHFTTDPTAEDIRSWVVAARIGLTHGWSHIYDLDLERAASIDLGHIYLAPPPSAWAVVPLTWMSTPAAYLVWTLLNVGAFVAVAWLVCRGTRF